MKISNVSKVASAGLIAASLVVVPLIPAHAQSTTGTSTPQDSNVNSAGSISNNTERDNNNWGWVGLLGLAGLAGLAKKSRVETVHNVSNDPNVAARPGNDFR